MFNLDGVIHQLAGNGQAIHALIQPISDEQAQWKPNPETWSMKDVMTHMYNEERIDFRKHLKEMLGDPPKPWVPFHEDQLTAVADDREALEGFLVERAASIAWLKELESPNWDVVSQAPWGPISAGDVLVSWVEHDFLHMRQMIELFYAWNARQADPYSVQYAGDW